MKNYVTYKSPIGLLYLFSENEFLTGIYFKKHLSNLKNEISSFLATDSAILNKTRQQLDEYFAGKRKKFSLKIKLQGTAFQKKSWLCLQKIPYGQTRSYAEQAMTTGSSRAFRAVGTANGKNPVAIVIPCHRVIRADGTLGGYNGGLHTKKFLLQLEGL